MSIGLTGIVACSNVNLQQGLLNNWAVTCNDDDYIVLLRSVVSPRSSGTITLPSSPFDGQIMMFINDFTTTNLTVLPSTLMDIGVPTTFTAGVMRTAVWSVTAVAWVWG